MLPIFTVAEQVESGAIIQPREVAGAILHVLTVGEEGRGRKLASLTVEGAFLVPCTEEGAKYSLEGPEPPDRPDRCPCCNGNIWGNKYTWGCHEPREYRVLAGTLQGKTLRGSRPPSGVQEKAIVVLRSPIGFRGGNAHTGDRAPSWTPERGGFLPFPGEVIAQGRIAQGDAGRMGSGDQLVAIMPKNTVWRVAFSGRRYGKPACRYYLFDGRRIITATPEERDLLPQSHPLRREA